MALRAGRRRRRWLEPASQPAAAGASAFCRRSPHHPARLPPLSPPQFVDLLKEHCGIDPDKPLECQEVGPGARPAWRFGALPTAAAVDARRPPPAGPLGALERLRAPPLPPAAAKQVGQDRLSAAFTEMMREDGKADALLDQAMDKFEASCLRLRGPPSEAVLGLLSTCRRASSAPAGR